MGHPPSLSVTVICDLEAEGEQKSHWKTEEINSISELQRREGWTIIYDLCVHVHKRCMDWKVKEVYFGRNPLAKLA